MKRYFIRLQNMENTNKYVSLISTGLNAVNVFDAVLEKYPGYSILVMNLV